MSSFWPLVTPNYSKSAQVPHQNWNPTIRSIWLFAGRAFMTISSLVNFALKSKAGIKLFTLFTTSTKPFCAIRIMFSVVWRAASRCPISDFPRRVPSGQAWAFSESPKLHKYKWKSIKMSSFWFLITPEYSKSAQVSHQNWNPTIRSIWLFAGRAFMSIFALLNFTLKSPARIKILTFLTTSTKPFCAIRVMFSMVWRAAFRCSSSPFRSDFQVARNEFFENSWNTTNINENQSKCEVLELL